MHTECNIIYRFICRMDRRRFPCTLCNKSFSRRYRANFHIKNYHGNISLPTTCSICKRKFSTTFSRKRHEDIVHKRQKKFNCLKCEKSFSVRGNLLSHTRVAHGAQKLQCPNCERQFAYASSLKEHRCVGQEKEQFKCDLCESVYKHKRSLAAHVSSKHDEKKYVCEHCGQEFTFASSLRKHKKRKHSLNRRTSHEQSLKKSELHNLCTADLLF